MSTVSDQAWKDIFAADPIKDKPRGWIQWKGTHVCIDLHCECGKLSHYDGTFLYFWSCPHCNRIYAVAQNVRLIKLTNSQVGLVKQAGHEVKTSDPDIGGPDASVPASSR